jgi:hypothetical protein
MSYSVLLKNVPYYGDVRVIMTKGCKETIWGSAKEINVQDLYKPEYFPILERLESYNA